MTAGKAALSAVVAGGALFASAAPAAADGVPVFATYAFGTCDTATGWWTVDWQLINESSQTATIVNAEFRPTEYPIEGVPATIAPKTTVHATQRLAGTPGLTSTLVFTAEFEDGSSRFVNWSFRPRTVCNKA
jgi:hypothetical protein